MSLRALSLGLMTLMSGACAASPTVSETSTYPAILKKAADNNLRDNIRNYVRDVAGQDYIVVPDQLLTSDTLIATDRGRSTAMQQPRLRPDRVFRLERVERTKGAPVCRLVPPASDEATRPLVLPDGSVCRTMSRTSP